MSAGRDEGPVYYREIQKNAYLKRIPEEGNTSKLRPLGHKKPPLKPMWTLFCVHNGRTPFLEQYPEAESPATLGHRPAWRACLRTARHVTASVKPRGGEYDFLVDTDHGPVRMLAPDWDTMQEWVTTLRNKLHELKILARGENVYGAPPVAPPPRAAARDPTSPLPPTPPVPPDRVPGIEIAQAPRTDTETTPVATTATTTAPTTAPAISTVSVTPSISTDIDISNWDTPFSSLPSTSNIETKKIAKICGQNICLDDSILKRNVTDSDEEFFSEIDQICDEVECINDGFKQTVVVGEQPESLTSQPPRTNVTVIQVSNKPPHTAIPVIGPENVFDFNFKKNVTVTPETFVNIVNTEENDYGTVFTKNDYGHLSLTTTVSLTGVTQPETSVTLTPVTSTPVSTTPVNLAAAGDVYERLCMASTSRSPLPVRCLRQAEKVRKSSLPNLNTESAYECLFPAEGGRFNVNSESVESGNSVSEAAPNLTENGRNAAESGWNLPESGRNLVETSRRLPENGRNVVENGPNRPSPVVKNVERSNSQNASDNNNIVRENSVRNNSPKREIKNEKSEPTQTKPIWKRGLTELSLLSRLRGIGQGRRQDSPTRHERDDRSVTSPVKVVHRSRPVNRVDSTRRRSNSLSNCQPPVAPAGPAGGVGPGGAGGPGGPVGGPGGAVGPLAPLRCRQAAALRAEQRRGACVAAALPPKHPPLLADYDGQVWVARWGPAGVRCGGRAGDRVAALGPARPAAAAHARLLLRGLHPVDILFHRVPLGKIYVVNKRDHEPLGIKLDSECTITSVDPQSVAARAGMPPAGRWAVTEVNNRPINLLKGGEEEMNRLYSHGTEVSILIQPAPLVKKLRAAIKSSKPLLGLR